MWEPAEKVQKNANGEYRALIGGEWIPVQKAQKSPAGEFRIMRNSEQPKPSPVQPQQPERSLLGSLGRQVGLTARHGIEGVGDTLDFMASPARIAMNAVLPDKYEISGRTGEAMANLLNLPSPENSTERVVGDVARTMAGTAGMGGLAKIGASGLPADLAQSLTQKMGAQLVASAGAGAGGGIARESGAGPTGQIVASLAGGIAPSAASAMANYLKNSAMNAGATIGASFGNEKGIERIAKDAAKRVAGDTRQQQIEALKNAPKLAGTTPTVAEALAGEQIGKPGQFGGATIRLQKDLSGAMGLEDILPGNQRTQRQQMADFLRGVKDTTKPMRENALAAANKNGGVDANSIVAKIDESLADPDFGSVSLVKKALAHLKNRIDEESDEFGKLDAKAAYNIRKEIGNTVQQYSKETANWDKKLTRRIERAAQLAIDDAIEGAGGKGWGKYLDTYSSGMKEAENAIARQREAKIIGAGVKGGHAAALAADELPRPPTLLSRPMMALNYGLRLVSRDANTPIAKRLAEKMIDPEAYAKLLEAENVAPMSQRAKDAAKRAAMASLIYQQGE